MAFLTIFIVLPKEKVCTLREVQSGTRVRDIRSRLEICAGLPSQIYDFTSRNGQVVHEDQILELGLNVWNGFLLRVELKESWKLLFEAVISGDLDFLLRDRQSRVVLPSVELSDKKEYVQPDDERACVALYLASWTGSVRICQGLLTAGVNPNMETPHHRTPIFAAVVRDNHLIMDILVKHGALLFVKDCNGDTPLDIARRYFAAQCINRIRGIMKDQLRCGSNTSSVRSSINFSRTTGTLSLPIKTSTNFSHRSRPFTVKERQINNHLMNKRSQSDSSFNRRSVAFKDEEQHKHRAKFVLLRAEGNLNLNDKPIQFQGSFTSNSVESSDIPQPEYLTPKMANDIVLKAAVSIPNSFREKRNKIQGVIVHNDVKENLGFLNIKSAVIEDKLQNKLLYSGNASDRSCNVTGVKEDTLITCPDVETTAKDPRGDVQNITTNNEDNNNITPGFNNNKNESNLEPKDVRNDEQQRDTERISKVVRPVTARRPKLFRNKEHKRKKGESLKKALRQIQLAEGQKRTSSANERAREAFRQWLRKKRELEHQSSSLEDSDDSSDTSTDEQTSLSFPVWLKQIRDRSKCRHDSANSLKYRSIKLTEALVEIHNPEAVQSVKAADTQSYMHAFKEWREKHKPFERKEVLDAKEAKRLLVEKRKQMMATAITFNEWMTNCEERKYLTSVINRSENKNYYKNERTKTATKGSRDIENQKLRDGVENFEQLHRGHVKSNVRREDKMVGRPIKCVSFDDDALLAHGLSGVRHNFHSSNTLTNKAKIKT